MEVKNKKKTKRFIYNLLLVSFDTIISIIKMLTSTQEQILSFLISHPEEQNTIRGIAKRLNKSYTLVYNNIAKLEKSEIVTKESVPPSKITKINEFAPVDILVDVELRRKREFLKKYPWIQVMLNDVLSNSRNLFFVLMVFGSYAKEKQTKNSDLDLLIIVQDKKDAKEIDNAVSRAYTKIKKGVNLIDADDFKEMIKNTNELNIGNEAKKHHIILYGAEIYYELIR